MAELTVEEKAKKMITWLREEADEDDINFLYDYITDKKECCCKGTVKTGKCPLCGTTYLDHVIV